MNATLPALPQTVSAADLAKLAAPDETLAMRVIARRISNTGVYTMRGLKRRYRLARNATVAAHVLDIPLSLWMRDAPAKTYVDNLSIAHDIQASRNGLKSPLIYLVVPWEGKSSQLTDDIKKMIDGDPQYLADIDDATIDREFYNIANALNEDIPGTKIYSEEEFIGGSKIPEAEKATPLQAFKRLAEVTGAPPVIMSAIEMLLCDMQPSEIETALAEMAEKVALSIPLTPPEDESSYSASPPSVDPAELVAILALRLSEKFGAEQFKEQATPEIMEMIEREVTLRIPPTLKASGLGFVADFLDRFWADQAASKEAAPPSVETAEEKKARTNAERQKAYRERRKAEKAAKNQPPA